jgi:hypothetical protein
MTHEVSMGPFIALFATRIEPGHAEKIRYDQQRQLSEVFVDGKWVDAAASVAPLTVGTRVTKVSQETTDDE